MKILTILVIITTWLNFVKAEQPKSTRGFTYNVETEEAVANASVLIKDQGVFARTDSLGFFEVFAEKGSKIRVVHQDFFTYDTVILDSIIVIHLTPTPKIEYGDGADESLYYKTDIARTTIKSDMLDNIPKSSFFSDISTSLSLLPGINRTTGWSSLLNVRGGSPFDNLYLLNGLPVFTHYMWGGHLSVFNANLVQNMNVYRGNFPARYFHSLSGVFDIQYREGSSEKFSGEINASADAGFIVEGPIGLENGSFIVSARRTYYDFFSNLIINVDDRYSENPIKMPYFQDVYGSVSTQFSDNFHLRLWALGVEDGGDFLLKYNDSTLFGDDDRLNYEVDNWLGAAQIIYEHDPSNKFELSLSQSYYRGFQNRNALILSINTEATQTYSGFNLEYTRTKDNYTFNAGSHTLLFDVYVENETRGFVEFETSDTLSFVELSDRIAIDDFLVNVGFAEIKLKLGRVTAIPGLSVFYNNALESNRIAVDHRLNLNFQLFKNGYLNSGVGTFSKPALIPLHGGNRLLPEQAIHYFLGFSSTFGGTYHLSADVFYKDYNNLLVEYWDSLRSQIRTSNNMVGFSRGIEVMFLKSPTYNSILDGMVAYSFATSQRAAQYRPDSLVWFVPPQNQTHTISIMANYRLLKIDNHTLVLRNRFDFNTGRPYRDFAIVEALFPQTDTTLPPQTVYIPEPTNLNLRLPYHMNLDIGLEYILDFERVDISAYFIVMNVFDRKNITGYIVNNRTGERLPEISHPGTTIPTAGIRIKF